MLATRSDAGTNGSHRATHATGDAHNLKAGVAPQTLKKIDALHTNALPGRRPETKVGYRR
jgi:hypothetical protein